MPRITFFALLAAFAVAAVAAADSSTTPNASSDLALLDDDSNPIYFFNGGGDPDDDDYDDDDELEELEARSLEARNKKTKSKSKKHHRKHKSRKTKQHYTVGPDKNSKKAADNVQITWYASNDLKNPQCGDGSWNPTNSAHIGAVVKNWSNGPQCGEFVQICNPKKNNHCVKVRVVDKCAGCGENHVDLTKSAFKKLSPSGTLTEGRIHGLEMFSCSQKVNPWDRQLYGPFKLKL